jgi:hypothetical protein
VTLDVQTGLTTPPKSHYSPARVLLSGTICSTRESEKNDARLMLPVTDELGPRTDKKGGKLPDDDDDGDGDDAP